MPHPTKGGVLRVVLGDQCSRGLASLRDLNAARDVVLLAEVTGECTYVRHHKQKIVLVLSAMRHFARALEARGVRVDYVRLDDPENTGTLAGEVARAAARHAPEGIVCTFPGEWRVLQDMRSWEDATGIPVEIRDDDRFLCDLGWFRRWAQGKNGGKKQLRMEFFYREMRRANGLLMEGDAPAGGAWNYDAENRKRLDPGIVPPAPERVPPDAITREVMALVEARFPDHFGTLDAFAWPVTAQQAEAALADFIAAPPAALRRLPGCHGDGAGGAVPRLGLHQPQYRPALAARLLRSRRGGLARGKRAAERGRGLHPADPRLAGIRAGHLLAEDA